MSRGRLLVLLLTFFVGFLCARVGFGEFDEASVDVGSCAGDSRKLSEVEVMVRSVVLFDSGSYQANISPKEELGRASLNVGVELDAPQSPSAWSDEEVARLGDVLARNPQPFPSDLPDRFRPVFVDRVLRDSIDACGLRLKVIEIECDEFPCIAWVDTGESRLDMGACPSWSRSFEEDTLAHLELLAMNDGGQLLLAGLMPVPKHPVQRKVAVLRMENRCRLSTARLAADFREGRR